MDPGCIAAAFRHWGEAGILWECIGGGGALPLFAEGDEAARGKDRPGAWQGSKQGEGGMALGALCTGVVAGGERVQEAPELSDAGLAQERLRGDTPLIRRPGEGVRDGLDAGSDDVGGTHVMGAEEAL